MFLKMRQFHGKCVKVGRAANDQKLFATLKQCVFLTIYGTKMIQYLLLRKDTISGYLT